MSRRRRFAILLMIPVLAFLGMRHAILGGRQFQSSGPRALAMLGVKDRVQAPDADDFLKREMDPNHAEAMNWDTLLYKTSRRMGGPLGSTLARQTSCVVCHK